MCCPYFLPTRPHGSELWPHRQRLPLGECFAGCCSAPGHENETPTDTELKQCNVGYARCSRLPSDVSAHAVRFCVGRDSAQIVQVIYVCELNHLPAEHGTLEFSREASAWVKPHPDYRIQRKAESYLQTFFNRRQSAEEPQAGR